MRSAGRRLSGGSADERWRCGETKATPSAKESTERIKDGSTTGVCRSEPWIVRSGIVAFGKEVSGQPPQSDASFISIGEETLLFACCSVPSRAQIETQATNSHMRLIGSSVAISLLSRKHCINIALDHTYPICFAPFELNKAGIYHWLEERTDDPFGGGWNSLNIGVKSQDVKEKSLKPADAPL